MKQFLKMTAASIAGSIVLGWMVRGLKKLDAALAETTEAPNIGPQSKAPTAPSKKD